MVGRWVIGVILIGLLAIGSLWVTGRMNMSEGVDSRQKEVWTEPKRAAEAGGTETATFAGGCFWCTEAVFLQLNGVKSVVSGYSGGDVANPSYEDVVGGDTGHAEAIQITFDPHLISYPELLEVFWNTHDPTTLNRQGNDVGPQYRSVIFAHSPEQKRLAEHYKQRLNEVNAFGRPIVTTVDDFTQFYPAESYHQEYFDNNRSQGYCQFIIAPKVDKVKKVFKEKLK